MRLDSRQLMPARSYALTAHQVLSNQMITLLVRRASPTPPGGLGFAAAEQDVQALSGQAGGNGQPESSVGVED
ncbi:hypothetical protein A6A07_29615 [Streptomyces sp. CB03911]|nr:hypothetical protein A6A07_29615 [Streptomyces sp. CB03911]